jgi:F-type H+-transporting ATPase subunit b
LELAQKKATEQLKEAKAQAAAIIEQANKRGVQIVEEAKEQARAEGERLKASAQAEIVQETNRAKEALRAQVATLALAGASKVLGSSVDAAKHTDLLNQLAQEL